ncbi:MAG: FeoA family protein [Sumerlaeia bacterium]
MDEITSLDRLTGGETAIVEDICSECVDGCRLAAMGLAPGAMIRMLMPGRTCAVQVGQCRLMLRSKDATGIRVSRLAGSAA